MRPSTLILLWFVALMPTGCAKHVITDDDIMKPSRLVPLAAGVNPEEIRIAVDGEISLAAWWLGKESDFTVLVFHDDGNLLGTASIVNALSGLPANLLLVDYRGYGTSSGEPSEGGLYQDAEAVWEYLVAKKGIRPESIVVYGRRLGASLALDLAGKRQVGGLILEYVFASAARFWAELNELFPFYLNLEGEPDETFDNLAKVSRCSVPMLFISSSGSNYLSSQAKQVMQASPSKDKRIVTIKGEIADKPEIFVREISDFLAHLSSR